MVAERSAQLAERDAELAELGAKKARLQEAYEALKAELELLKRRIFVASAERQDTRQLELEFEALTKRLDDLAGVLPKPDPEDVGEGEAPAGDPSEKRRRRKGGGRRDLAATDLPIERVEVFDELFEELVAEGKAERIDFEESSQLGYKRGGHVRVVTARAKYRAIDGAGETTIETAPVPRALLRRCLATASLLGHIATAKFNDGLPLYRLEEILARDGATVDRGTMSRWMEQLGGSFNATVVDAMRRDALCRAFVIATDATGFCVQPGPLEKGAERRRRPCRRGHYSVQIADRDHVLFEFTARETSASVKALFRGFEGYVQADAASVYNALFRTTDSDHDGCDRTEVGCWSHGRRKYWEAAMAKSTVAREALVRIGKVFEVDAAICSGVPPGTGRPARPRRIPPSKIKALRDLHLRPLVEDFLAWADVEYARVKDQRGSLRSALGYTVRQARALRAFLDDGRLRLDNNPSENELRKVVRIRDAALFAGSDEHAQSAAGILTLIASARLHNLDVERYLIDIIRVLPHWPRERFLELSPLHWLSTRARMNATELDAQVGTITVPDPA